MFAPFSYKGKGFVPRKLECDGKHLIESVLWKKKQIKLDDTRWYIVDTGDPNAYFHLIIGDLVIDIRRYPQRELEDWVSRYFEIKSNDDPMYHRLANGVLERFSASGEQTLSWTSKLDGSIYRHDIYFGENLVDFDLPVAHAFALAHRLAEIAVGGFPANGTLHKFEIKLGCIRFSAEGFAKKRDLRKFGVPARVEEVGLSLRKV